MGTSDFPDTNPEESAEEMNHIYKGEAGALQMVNPSITNNRSFPAHVQAHLGSVQGAWHLLCFCALPGLPPRWWGAVGRPEGRLVPGTVERSRAVPEPLLHVTQGSHQSTLALNDLANKNTGCPDKFEKLL